MFDKLMGLFQTPQYEVEAPPESRFKAPDHTMAPIPSYKEFITNVPIGPGSIGFDYLKKNTEEEIEQKPRFSNLAELLRGSYK